MSAQLRLMAVLAAGTLSAWLPAWAQLPAGIQPGPGPDLSSPAGRSAARAALLMHRPALRPARPQKADAQLVMDLLNVSAELDFGGGDLPLSGQYSINLRANEDLESLSFFFPFATVRSARVDGAEVPFEFNAVQGVLRLPLPLSAQRLATVDLTASLAFQCVDDIACITEPPLIHVVDTGWYPINAQQPLDDAFELAVGYRNPAWPVAATGARETIERDAAGLLTWRYRTERDAVLAAFAVGPFRRVSYTPLVEVFAPDNGFDDGLSLAGLAQSAADFYQASLGFYPFSRLGIAPISEAAGVALGPQANILVPEGFFQIAPANADAWTVVRQVLAHEIGHQYFFNTVRVAADDEAWLSESFAEYLSLRFEAATDPDEALFLENYWGYVRGVPPQDDAPIHSQAVRSSPAYFEIVYQKGSAALSQLRRRLSGPVFDAALQAYVTVYTDRAADTDGFRAVIERQTGVDLRSYFAQWIDRPGFPTLTIKVAPARTERSGYAFTIRQESPLGVFEDDLPVLLLNAGGESAVAVVGLSGEFAGPESPQSIQVDPQHTVFRRLVTDPPGDVNLSGVVDGLDLLDVTFAQGRRAGEPGYVETADVNGDGVVDSVDLEAVRANFGQGW